MTLTTWSNYFLSIGSNYINRKSESFATRHRLSKMLNFALLGGSFGFSVELFWTSPLIDFEKLPPDESMILIEDNEFGDCISLGSYTSSTNSSHFLNLA